MGILEDLLQKKQNSKSKASEKVGHSSKKETEKRKSTHGDRTPNTQPTSSSIFSSIRKGLSPSNNTPKNLKNSATDNSKNKSERHTKDDSKKETTNKSRWLTKNNNNNNEDLKKNKIKSSTSSLNTVNPVQRPHKSETPKRRPKTVAVVSSNVTVRRGQKEGHNHQDNISRTSSITNLDSLDQNKIASKGAKPRKSASKERIDKIVEKDRRNDAKKGVTKNNNQLDSEGNNSYSLDSVHEEELIHLRRQLQEMANEKTNLALQLGEQKGQLAILQKEIQKLKAYQEDSHMELEKLSEENTALRNRLRDVAHSPLSDNEKQQLLFESHRHHSSAPASIATNVTEENAGDHTACTTPDWDKHSSSNVSEVSVACLQDKINQMQETHYSTNEELQATLQELTDLQSQLTELQRENERLTEEKTLMFDSLCRQTERLTDARQEADGLRQVLYHGSKEEGNAGLETIVERERKLVDLLKTTQDERETVLVKLEQVGADLQDARQDNISKSEHILQLAERVKTLECTLDAKHAEHKQLDQELAIAKDQCSGKQIEINRLSDLLENARTKIHELEQDRTLSDKSELEELLDNSRKEKDQLESEIAHLKEQLARSKNEAEKFREQVQILQEECKVTRNNAKSTQSDLEYKCEKLQKDKTSLADQLQHFQEAVNELQVQSQCQLEDKRQLSTVLSETQRNLNEAERKNIMLESKLQELEKLRQEENDEWEKFQNDLLTSVRVANDFKTEAQQELQKIILENKSFRERVRQLESQIDKLNKGVHDHRKRSSLTSINSSSKDDSKNMEDFFKIRRKSREKEAPRVSKESLTSTSTDNSKRSDKKQNSLSKFVKRRENRNANRKHIKNLSIEEELLLKTLDNWYENIDNNKTEENLTQEEIAVKKLKTLYEEDIVKVKPVAKKAKELLAISKPLLDSVYLNPKLEEIANDPSVPSVEEEKDIKFRNSLLYDDRPKLYKLKSQPSAFDFFRRGKIHKSKSLDDLNSVDSDNKDNRILYRSVETENLTQDFLVIKKPSERISGSTIQPDDSVSNARCSDIPKELHQNVSYETLEDIVRNIPNDFNYICTNEERFALKLKQALDDAEKKSTLKKIKRSKKNVKISNPLPESVEANVQLKKIIENPDFKVVPEINPVFYIDYKDNEGKRYSYEIPRDFEDDERYKASISRIPSKSVENISFIFNSSNTTSSITSNTTTSAEFNVKTGEISYLSNKEELSDTIKYHDSLLYNDTLPKQKYYSSEYYEVNYEIPNTFVPKIESCSLENCDEHDSSYVESENQTLKENKYGVVSPLDVRMVYKSVVKEFKHKYTNEDEENNEEIIEDNISENDDFLDDFFGVTKRNDSNMPDVISRHSDTETVKQIDKDMSDIMERYLNTRTSLILKHTAVDSNHKNVACSNLKKYDNVNLQEIDDKNTELSTFKNMQECDKFLQNERRVYQITSEEYLPKFSDKEINDNINNLTDDELKLLQSTKDRFSRSSSGLNEQDIKMFEEISKRYIENEETNENDKQIIESNQNEDGNNIEGAFSNIPVIYTEEIDNKTEDPNEYIATHSNKEDIHENINKLNEDEVKLLKLVQKDRSSRPLSDLNDNDLKMVQELSKKYSDEQSNQNEDGNNIEETFYSIPTIYNEEIDNKTSEDISSYCNQEDINENMKKLTEDEVKLLNVVRKNRFSRPLSDLNDDDLKMFEEISKRYNEDENIENEDHLKYENKDLEPNFDSNISNYESGGEFSRQGSFNSAMQLSKKRFEERRKLKSWIHTSVDEPLYANIQFVSVANKTKSNNEIINKKPLPVPRCNVDANFENDINMNSQHENFCELSEKDADNMEASSKVNLEEISRDGEQKLVEIQPDSSANEEISNNVVENELEKHETENLKESDRKVASNVEPESTESILENVATGSTQNLSSYSSIAVSGKFEQLDLTKQGNKSISDYLQDKDIEEVKRNSIEASTVNLFELEASDSCDDSYLDLFKTKEQNVYDNLTNKKKSMPKGVLGVAYLNEPSDEDIDGNISEEYQEENRPKIVDFVPLDDKTEPVFNKQPKTEKKTSLSNFDTLEREKTFQVLNVASKISEGPEIKESSSGSIEEKKESRSSLELLAKKSSFTSASKSSSSRTSFNQAKKLFEALVEANTTDATKVKNKSSKEDVKDP